MGVKMRSELDTPNVDLCVMCHKEGSVRLLERHEEPIHLLPSLGSKLIQLFEALVINDVPIYLIPSAILSWPSSDGQCADRCVGSEKMGGLSWTASEAAIGVLPGQNGVDRP